MLWVDESDASRLPGERYAVEVKDREYVYDPSRVAAAEGPAYRDLRKRLMRFRRHTEAHFRPLRDSDMGDCHCLLKHWRRLQGRRRPFLLDWGYTRAALDRYGEWTPDRLRGWCVETDGGLSAFALAGPIQERVASFFVAKSDPTIWGLSDYLRWRVYRELSGYFRVNDAGDLGLPGLAQHKRKFRAAELLPVYTATRRL